MLNVLPGGLEHVRVSSGYILRFFNGYSFGRDQNYVLFTAQAYQLGYKL